LTFRGVPRAINRVQPNVGNRGAALRPLSSERRGWGRRAAYFGDWIIQALMCAAARASEEWMRGNKRSRKSWSGGGEPSNKQQCFIDKFGRVNTDAILSSWSEEMRRAMASASSRLMRTMVLRVELPRKPELDAGARRTCARRWAALECSLGQLWEFLFRHLG
jgi:hypothetical protein